MEKSNKKPAMNKKSVKILITLLLAAVLVFSVFIFVSCDDPLQKQLNDLQDKVNGYEANNAEKDVVIYIGDEKTVEFTTRKNKLFEVLIELADQNKISNVKYGGSAYGAFLEEIEGLVNGTVVESKPRYIAIYHSIDDAAYKSPAGSYDDNWNFTPTGGFTEKQFKGETLFYSGVGVSALPVKDGIKYLITLE